MNAAIIGEPLFACEVEIDPAMDHAVAEMAVDRGVVAVAVEQGFERAQIGAEPLAAAPRCPPSPASGRARRGRRRWRRARPRAPSRPACSEVRHQPAARASAERPRRCAARSPPLPRGCRRRLDDQPAAALRADSVNARRRGRRLTSRRTKAGCRSLPAVGAMLQQRTEPRRRRQRHRRSARSASARQGGLSTSFSMASRTIAHSPRSGQRPGDVETAPGSRASRFS